MNQVKNTKVLVLKSKQAETASKSSALAARDVSLKGTTRFEHFAKYGRCSY